MSARWRSLATLSLISGLALSAMAGAVPILRLALADDAPAYRALVGDRVVGVAAAIDLSVAEAASDPAARARDLEALLARAPLNAGAWLDLAIARRAAGEPFARVVEALGLSALTGPREARLMKGRLAFALPFWAELPEQMKARLIDDLCGISNYLEPQELERMAGLVRLQSADDVAPICSALRSRQAADPAPYGC